MLSESMFDAVLKFWEWGQGNEFMLLRFPYLSHAATVTSNANRDVINVMSITVEVSHPWKWDILNSIDSVTVLKQTLSQCTVHWLFYRRHSKQHCCVMGANFSSLFSWRNQPKEMSEIYCKYFLLKTIKIKLKSAKIVSVVFVGFFLYQKGIEMIFFSCFHNKLLTTTCTLKHFIPQWLVRRCWWILYISSSDSSADKHINKGVQSLIWWWFLWGDV